MKVFALLIALLFSLLPSVPQTAPQYAPPDLPPTEAFHMAIEGSGRELQLINGYSRWEERDADNRPCDNTQLEKDRIPYYYLCPATTWPALTAYLEEVFTPEHVTQLFEDLQITEIDGMLAIPPLGACGCLDWAEAKIGASERTSATTLTYTFDVPDPDHNYHEIKVEYRHVAEVGWRLPRRPGIGAP